MTRGAVIVACLALLGCDEDPARKVAIGRPTASAKPSQDGEVPATAATQPKSDAMTKWVWRPELCPPPPEPAGGRGTLIGKGTCNFEQHGDGDCESLDDDFILQTSRPSANGAKFSIYLNVEKYRGPGNYDEAQMLVSVQDAKGLFRWRSDAVVATVSKGETFVKLEPVRLESLPPMLPSEIKVSGTIWCRPPAKKQGR
jgi:hypothetical protein